MLVTALLVLNLTVAVGTLNGIIFYVNILYNFILSFISHSRITFSSVFVSWLNLELGFDSCFFKGMDAYSKTWIELLFPMYVIFLVVMIIVVSEWSEKFSHLIGRRNPGYTFLCQIIYSISSLKHCHLLLFVIQGFMELHCSGYQMLLLITSKKTHCPWHWSTCIASFVRYFYRTCFNSLGSDLLTLMIIKFLSLSKGKKCPTLLKPTMRHIHREIDTGLGCSWSFALYCMLHHQSMFQGILM